MKIEMHPERCCVYHHLKDGKLFYVGSGKPARPFDMSNRNPTWRRIVGPERRFTVRIVRWFSDSVNARIFEEKQIKEFLPEANMVLSGRKIRTISYRYERAA